MSLRNTDFSLNKMEKLFRRAQKIFFVGIGGISMSSLAEYCYSCGKKIFGYDIDRSENCLRLEKIGSIYYYSSPDNVNNMDLIVYTGAMNESNREIQAAKENRIPIVSRANLLGYIMHTYRQRIGIAGMHGKSTTTAMIAHIFEFAFKNPTVFCGAEMIEYGKPCKIGNKDCFIFEACEYMDSFLNLYPTDAVITNIEFDHPDYFLSIEQIEESFNKYISKAQRVFVNSDDPLSAKLSHKNKITYGIGNENADYNAKPCPDPTGNCFEIYRNGEKLCLCKLRVFGKCNIYNALSAFAVAYESGIDKIIICSALSTFQGSKRRMEFIKNSDTGVPIYEDYAHHPTEIKEALKAFSDMGFENITCIFQSHTYSRTKALYKEFTDSFSLVKNLIITPIYPARETNTFDITDEGFAKDCGATFMTDYKEIVSFVLSLNSDVIIIMGAGNIDRLKKYF